MWKTFGTREILRGITLTIPRGETVCIIGGSGTGKSVTLKHIMRLLEPDEGKIILDGQDISHIQGRELVDARRKLGVLFQSAALLQWLTVGENVALPLKQWTDLDDQSIDAIVHAKLALVGLAGSEPQLPSEISGGMKKRAGIARALALDPPIIFLDEPSAGLDPVSSVELDMLIRTLSDSLGVTTVIVTHELQSIFAIAKHCIMLDKDARSIIAQGDPRELRDTSTDPRVARFLNRRAGEE